MIRDPFHLTLPRRSGTGAHLAHLRETSGRILSIACMLAAVGIAPWLGSLRVASAGTSDPNQPVPPDTTGQAPSSDPADRPSDPSAGGAPPESAKSDAKAGKSEAATKCPFCNSPQPAGAFFCARCGRLFRLKAIDPLHRFWGDAFYMVTFPPASDRISITSVLNDAGLTRESTALDSGERYDFDPLNRKGVIVTGEALAWGTTKAVPFHATVQTSLDTAQRIVLREIFGVVKADPSRHLYRKIEYAWEGDLLSRIDVATWLYPHDDDWKKHPSEWVHHQVVQIGIVYLDGVLSRISDRKGRAVGDAEHVRPPQLSGVDGTAFARSPRSLSPRRSSPTRAGSSPPPRPSSSSSTRGSAV